MRREDPIKKPNGAILLKLRPLALPLDVCDLARPVLRKLVSQPSHNRGDLWTTAIGSLKGELTAPTRRLFSSVPGLDDWCVILAYLRELDEVFRIEFPAAYNLQRKLALQHPDWTMGQTVFSTLTVNRWDATHDARTRLHRDKGNLAGSFAVISALRLGVVGRAYLVFPKFEVAVHLNDRDVLIADVNEFHGNVKMFYLGPAERISTIAYFHSSNLD